MNFWSFAATNPVPACIIALGAGASAVGVSYFFATNKTPVIGSISPSFNMSIGGVEENSPNKKDNCKFRLNGASFSLQTV
jgi:hypothetical protein